MSRFFLPRHARTHLPGGSDPLRIDPAGTVSWAIMADYQALAQDIDTFTFATPFFLTNDATMFTQRSGSPTYDGIAVLEQGIYEVTWAIEASWTGGTAADVDTIRLGVVAGSSFTDTHFFQIDDGDVYNYGTNDGSAGGWRVSQSGLIGFEGDYPADNYVTIGWSYTGGDNANINGRGAIYIKRISDFVDTFAAF